jgi:hypothetical protein
MGVLPFYGKRPQLLLWADSWAASGKITVIGTPNSLDYCANFTAYK